MWPIACFLALLSSAAMAQVTIDGLPNVPTFPLPDPGTTTSNVPITQGGGNYKIDPFKLGAIFQGASPPTNPWPQMLWWDLSRPTQPRLRAWNGSAWVTITNQGTVNIRNFGVEGDGTDQTANLQAAVNTSGGGGSCLYFPSSTPGYALSAAVTLPTGTCFVGDVGDTRIYELPGNTTGLFKMAANASLQMANIFLDGNRTAGATGDCLSTDLVTGAIGLTLDNITVRNCAGSGIFISGSSTASRNVQISNSFISLNGVGITGQYLTDFNITGNRIQNNDSHGMACGSSGVGYCKTGTIAGGNTFDANGCVSGGDNVSGQLEAIADVTVSNNVSRNACGEGIQFGGSRSTISGNHLVGNQQNGIFVQSVRKYTTGTISVANGSTAVTGVGTGWAGLCPNIQAGFISNTGTRLQLSAPPGNAVTGGGSVTGVKIKSIDSNTTLTLSIPWSGSSQLSVPYTIRCPVPAISPVVAANTVQGIPAGWQGIYVDQPSGGTITGNSVDDVGGLHGILVAGDLIGATISANTVASKTNSGIRADAEGRYGTGTVTATTGSPTVTLAGGSFDEIPNVTWFRAGSDPVAYQVNAQTATTLTLSTNYTGTTGSGKAYLAQSGMSVGTNISGNVSRLNDVGLNLAGCWGCAVSGGVYNSNTTASILESGASSHNIIAGSGGGTVTVLDTSTQWLVTGSASSMKLGNLPTTPSGKQPVCVDTATGVLYKGNAGAC